MTPQLEARIEAYLDAKLPDADILRDAARWRAFCESDVWFTFRGVLIQGAEAFTKAVDAWNEQRGE